MILSMGRHYADHSSFNKYHAPRRFKPGQRAIFTLKRATPEELSGCSSPPEAREARWAFALPSVYDNLIQAPAFVVEARKRAHGSSGHRASPAGDPPRRPRR
jgi:hypothetical protein